MSRDEAVMPKQSTDDLRKTLDEARRGLESYLDQLEASLSKEGPVDPIAKKILDKTLKLE